MTNQATPSNISPDKDFHFAEVHSMDFVGTDQSIPQEISGYLQSKVSEMLAFKSEPSLTMSDVSVPSLPDMLSGGIALS